MFEKAMRNGFIVLATVACAALLAGGALGIAGMLRLQSQSVQGGEQQVAAAGVLLRVAAVRDQLRAQARAAREARRDALEPFDSHDAIVRPAMAQLREQFGEKDAQWLGDTHLAWARAVRLGDVATARTLENALLERLERLSRGAHAVALREAAASASALQETWVLASGLLLALVACAIAFLVLFGARYARSVQGALGGDPDELAQAARKLATGDLGPAARLRPTHSGSLAAGLRDVGAALAGVVEDLRANAAQLSSAAQALAAGTAQIAAGSGEQTAAAARMASSVGDMTQSIAQVTAHSHTALRVSRESGELSEQASGVVTSASGELEGVADAARELTAIIQTLGQRSGKISSIVSVIQDIANQTNLLALNAAIEAARAGEQGRGFSVVADEVRKLADRTTQSTREIAAMIESIQQGTKQAVEHMDRWGQRVTDGVAKAYGAGQSMRKIRGGALEVIEAVDKVSGALAGQSAASLQIAAAVERIAAMSRDDSQALGALKGSAQAVEQLAQSLRLLATRFQAPAHA